MDYDALQTFAKAGRWADLEKGWLSLIEEPSADGTRLLPVIDTVVKAGQAPLADTLGWAWLSSVKESRPPETALQIGRELCVRLTDGDSLREEILALYRVTYKDRSDLEQWIDKAGLKSGKSVRRALRFLDTGLRLSKGAYLIHRSDDHAAQLLELDLAGDSATIQAGRRPQTIDLAELLDDYDVVEENDFRVLQQLRPERIAELAEGDPSTLAVGILRGHRNKITRDDLRVMLVPRHIPAERWSDWWTSLRNAVKKSHHLRIEGRSPMFLIYDPVGQTLEEETWGAFAKATTPREWLELLEGYLRETRSRKSKPDTAFIERVQKTLVGQIERFLKHKEPVQAFTTALVIERVAADGLPVSTDAHGMALDMLGKTSDPVRIVANVTDSRLWTLAVACVEQAFSDRWPELLAELILYAPAGQCDALAKKVEGAGRGEALAGVAERALAEPGRFTDAMMWLWKGPDVSTALPLPPPTEMLTLILALVGPARVSEGKAAGQSVNEMRARVRAGLSARDYGQYRKCLESMNDAMAAAMRRLIERAEGLGPSVQDDMANILRAKFPNMYVKPKVALWDDDSVLYFTGRGLKSKEQELTEIVNVKMRENAKAIGEAASHGDLSENSEYKFALEERDLLRARVAKLNRELAMAKLLEPADIPADHVSIGHRVTLQPVAGGASITVTILGADESDLAKQEYSYQSPFARSLLGKKIGERVSLSSDQANGEFTISAVASVLN